MKFYPTVNILGNEKKELLKCLNSKNWSSFKGALSEIDYDKVLGLNSISAAKLKDLGIDEIYCCSVNDSYVMNAWAKKMNISNVKVIPDGSGLFTKYMGMLISKDHDGFGQRSWRYMAIINDGVVEKWWQEPGINNSGSDDDPYVETTPENSISYLTETN